MSSNKDHQSAKATDMTTEIPSPLSLVNQIQQLIDERDQAEAALARAQTRIQELEKQSNESEEHRTKTEVSLAVTESLRVLTEALRTQAEENLNSCRSEYEQYKVLSQREFEAQLTRYSELEEQTKTLRRAFTIKSEPKEVDEDQMRELEAGYQAKLDELQAKYNKDTTKLLKSLEIQKIRFEARLNESELLKTQAQEQFQRILNESEHFKTQIQEAERSEFKAQLADFEAQAQAHLRLRLRLWETKNNQDIRNFNQKLDEDKLEISKLQAEITKLTQSAESQESQFTAVMGMQATKAEDLERRLRAKENEVVSLRGDLQAAKLKLDTEQKKFETLQHGQVQEVQTQLEKSRAKVRQVREIVKEMEEQLEETEAQLTQALAPAKNTKKRKIN